MPSVLPYSLLHLEFWGPFTETVIHILRNHPELQPASLALLPAQVASDTAGTSVPQDSPSLPHSPATCIMTRSAPSLYFYGSDLLFPEIPLLLCKHNSLAGSFLNWLICSLHRKGLFLSKLKYLVSNVSGLCQAATELILSKPRLSCSFFLEQLGNAVTLDQAHSLGLSFFSASHIQPLA